MGMAAWSSALFLLTLLQPATQDMVHLSAPTVLNAECGTEAILKCEVASPKHGLSVKHMGWYRNGGPLCSVKENVLIYHNHTHSLGRFHCLYSHGHLSLGLHNVQLQDGGNSTYVCKLRSNRGATHATTRLEFKELRNNCSPYKSAGIISSAWTNGTNGVGSARPIRTLLCYSLLVGILK